jgi:outer membrane immunogenic protein
MNARTLALLLLAIAANSAVHADAPPSGSIPPPLLVEPACCESPALWTGVFFGVQAGGAFSHPHWTFPFPETFNTLAGQDFSMPASGSILGAHLGANYQIHHFLIGAEISYVNNRLTNVVVGPISVFPTDRFTISAKDLFTVTGRMGYVHGQYLFYGKAGYANSSLGISADSPTTGVTAHANKREGGWTIGGGLDTRIVSNVLFGLEYSYVGLPSDRFTGLTSAVPGLPFNADIDALHMHTVTARLSVLFGPSICCTHGILEKEPSR